MRSDSDTKPLSHVSPTSREAGGSTSNDSSRCAEANGSPSFHPIGLGANQVDLNLESGILNSLDAAKASAVSEPLQGSVQGVNLNDPVPLTRVNRLEVGGYAKRGNVDESCLKANSSKNIVLEPVTAVESGLGESSNLVAPLQHGLSNEGEADQEEEEYECRYCHRKFTNKQSLGGHQNAHKLERALEKDAAEMHEARGGFFGGSLPYPRTPISPLAIPNSLKRSYEFMNRSLAINNAYQSQQAMQHHHAGMSAAGNHVRPVQQMAGVNNQQPTVPRHFLGFYHAYNHGLMPMPPPRITSPADQSYPPRMYAFADQESPMVPQPARMISPFSVEAAPTVRPQPRFAPFGETVTASTLACAPRFTWAPMSPPAPRISSQFTAAATPSCMPNLALTLMLPNPEEASSSYRPVDPAPSAYPGSRHESACVPGKRNNNLFNFPDDEEDDSNLDLTLKL